MLDQPNPFPPNNHPSHRLSDYEVDEKASEAQSLLDSPVFRGALNEVYSRAVQTLLNADVGSLTASTAHATMKSITDVQKQLEQYVADRKMRQKFSKGEKNG